MGGYTLRPSVLESLVCSDIIFIFIFDITVCSVRYRAWGEEVETSYGGFWDARSDVEGVHDVQLGLPSDPASNTQLFGQIAQLMVGDRSV